MGAGRKPGPRSRVRHGTRGSLSQHTPCHVTLRVRDGIPSLRSARILLEIEHGLRAACERRSFRVVQYSVQRDHVHFLVEAENPRSLACGMMSIGARIARAVHRVFGGSGRVLADRFHHRVLRTPREVRNALAYVLLNARKHSHPRFGVSASGVAGPDPGSSGRWFTGWSEPLSPAAESPAVAVPRSWLLRIGWRRHGAIDPREIPGRRR